MPARHPRSPAPHDHVPPTDVLPLPRPIIRVALVGSHRVVLDSLNSLIASEPDLRVLGHSAFDGSISLLTAPDIVLFDLNEGDDDCAFECLAKTAAMVRTIVLSSSTDPMVSFGVFQSGAIGLVSKRQSPEVVLTAIRKVHAGEAWIGRAMIANVLDLARSTECRDAWQSPAMVARDRQLITLVGEGWRNADIARHLMTSEATVRACLRSIYRKLGVSGRFAVMVYAAQHGLVNSRVRSVMTRFTPGSGAANDWPPAERPRRNRRQSKPDRSKTGFSS